VAIGATATSFLFMLLLFLRMSTTGLTAQALAQKIRCVWRGRWCSR
jgi:MATE family multidrug resistance protein